MVHSWQKHSSEVADIVLPCVDFCPSFLVGCCARCLQVLFMSMDKDNDGRISAADLHSAIEQVCMALCAQCIDGMHTVTQGVVASMRCTGRVHQQLGLQRSALHLVRRACISSCRACLWQFLCCCDADVPPLFCCCCSAQIGASIDEAELSELFMVADITGQGVIDYEEFIAAMLDSRRVVESVDALRTSFEQLDRDGDGFISVQDLAQVGTGWLPAPASMSVSALCRDLALSCLLSRCEAL